MTNARFRLTSLIAIALLPAVLAPAAPGASEAWPQRDAIQQWVSAHREEILAEMSEWLSIPNDSHDIQAMRINAEHLRKMLQRRGLEVRLLESGAAPYVYARLRPEGGPAATPPPSVLIYAHYDGQAVDPSRWTVTGPYTPRLDGPAGDPETRIYARSAADDKGTIIALMGAIDALCAAGIPPSLDARFIFDPEEELSSPHLEEVLTRNRDLLKSDLMIFADGPRHQSGLPTLIFGTRGIVTVRLTVYGPSSPLHSGHYGNWAPNPAEKLSRLLASMKDVEGRVLVEGWYDDVVALSPAEREAIATIPAIEGKLQDDLLIAKPDGSGKSLQELINLPSLNISGLGSAWIGDQARTIIPSTAVAELDLRLVKNVMPAAQVERIKAHVRKMGFHVVEEEPDAQTRRRHPDVVRVESDTGIPATRTGMDSPISRSLIAAIRRATESEPVLMPSLGGTGPLYPFEQILDLPVYGVPIVNHDNNQHAPDENLRLGNLWDGIAVYASVLRLPRAE